MIKVNMSDMKSKKEVSEAMEKQISEFGDIAKQLNKRMQPMMLMAQKTAESAAIKYGMLESDFYEFMSQYERYFWVHGLITPKDFDDFFSWLCGCRWAESNEPFGAMEIKESDFTLYHEYKELKLKPSGWNDHQERERLEDRLNSLPPQPTSEQQTNFNGNTSFETFEQYLKHIDLVKESDPEKYDFINEVFNEVTDIDLSRFVERLALSFEKNKKAYSEISTKAGKEIFIKEQIELYTYATHRYKKYGRYANAALDKWKPVFIEILEYWKNEFKEKDTKEPEPTVNVENQFSNDFKALFNCQNFLIPKVAIEDVYNHFKILTETTNKFNEFYLTNEQLYFFIKSTFIDKKPERKKFNGIPKPKKNVRKVFYEFYVKCGKYETNQTSIKRKYFNIMNDAFEGFNENDYNDFHKT